jgi:TrmH family RNA methyltransferase
VGDFRVVLVSPLFAGNVGSVARLAANFDVSEVVLVSPRCDVSSVDARMMATGVAVADLQAMRVVDSLAEALEGCSLRIGFSCRETLLSIPETRLSDCDEWYSTVGPVALIFGREDHGLERSELALCSHYCSIPTSSRKSSMNLSHAVAVVLSRIFEMQQFDSPTADENGDHVANGHQIDVLMKRWREVLDGFHFGERPGGIDLLASKIRALIVRSKPTFHEIKILHAFLSRTSELFQSSRENGVCE